MVGDIKINNYYFFSVGSFPFGDAATNRALSYMRGLTEIGCQVILLVLAPNDSQSSLSNLKNTDYKGIKIKYTCPSLFVKKGIVSKLNFIIGILVGYFLLIKILIKHREKAFIFLLFVDPILIWLFLIPIKIFGAKVFHERTEFPFINKKNDRLFNFYINKLITRFDGIYVISFALFDYFKTITNKPVLHLPMTVEFNRFSLPKKEKKIKYIAYCGSMYTDKDGVPDLIDAFNIVAEENPEVYLYLIGDNLDRDKFQFIINKTADSPVKDRIICTGHIERDEMPELLNNATMLALCRPANIQAQGGFPTKLGEYLATANPVVITDVGDHTRYLKHRVSAFVALPDNPVDFAAKMQECLSDKALALSVGRAGYEVMMEHFNYKKQASLLKYFVENKL